MKGACQKKKLLLFCDGFCRSRYMPRFATPVKNRFAGFATDPSDSDSEDSSARLTPYRHGKSPVAAKSLVAADGEKEEEERSCWVCLSGDFDGHGNLMRGCACRGTAGWVHAECIVAANEHRRDKHSCPTCASACAGIYAYAHDVTVHLVADRQARVCR